MYVVFLALMLLCKDDLVSRFSKTELLSFVKSGL